MRLVLLPGLNGSCTLFEPLLAHLPPAMEVQALTLPAQGNQDPANLANRLLSALGNTPYVLLGESFSGPLTYQLALRQPSGLRGVIFVASFLSRPHPLLQLIPYLPLPTCLLRQHILLRLFCLNGQASVDVIQTVREEIKKLPQRLLRARLLSLDQLQEPLLQLQLPALHLVANRDRLVTRKAQVSLNKYCTQLTQIGVDGPHFLLQTRPQACAMAIQQFISALATE